MAYPESESAVYIEKKDVDALGSKIHDLHTSMHLLLDRIGDARIVLLGEATHGTHEYYLWRARITQQLVQQKGFNIIGIEGDWPDCYNINRYVKNYSDSGSDALDVLSQFRRWPTWMWANWEMAAFMKWLRGHNRDKPRNAQVGFYGLDLYSLWDSLQAILDYLGEGHPETTRLTKQALRCFEPYRSDGVEYGSSGRLVDESCEGEVLALLKKIRSEAPLYDSDPEAPFSAEQNARTAVNAEKYYRAMLTGNAKSWNVRDMHMTETLDNLLSFHGQQSKAIVWAHNTHVGDARATDMASRGLVNIGQVVRDTWSEEDVVLVGFGSYQGSVIAGPSWGSRMQKMRLPQARAGSWEALLHKHVPHDKLIITADMTEEPWVSKPIGHRAVGVVYNPEMEHFGNYVPTVMPERYDAFIFIDQTEGLHPVYTSPERNAIPETFPWGI